jgi:hypothetical protein
MLILIMYLPAIEVSHCNAIFNYTGYGIPSLFLAIEKQLQLYQSIGLLCAHLHKECWWYFRQ